METLAVDLGERSYNIHIGTGLLKQAGALVSPVLAQKRAIIVTDAHVAPHYLSSLEASLSGAGIACASITLPAGEQTKNFAHLEQLLDDVLGRRIERGTSLIALGGGVIGDLTGFAAAIALRGIPFIQIPTTLLSQVDSSVGGKTGINTRHGKNLVGAFYQPRLVLADIDTLDTLPRRELLAGYAEVVKYGLIRDAAFYDWCEANGTQLVDGDKDARVHAVRESCAAKAAVVAKDERESGERALLNFGHTFGHALESETGFSDTLLHGEAVALGMLMAFDLSARIGLCPGQDAVRVRKHFEAVGLPHDPRQIAGVTWNADTLISHMALDKKVRDGKLTFILCRGIGEAFVTQDVKIDDVRGLMSQALAA